MDKDKTLYERLGGADTLKRVHKIFYDEVYEHEWLKHFFTHFSQSLIETQQTHFMAEKMGGPRDYVGKPPKYAHRHMFITEELFELRQKLLKSAILEAGVAEAEMVEWLKLDALFKKSIVKHSVDECRSRWSPYH